MTCLFCTDACITESGLCFYLRRTKLYITDLVNAKGGNSSLNKVAKIHNQSACGRVYSFQQSNNRTTCLSLSNVLLSMIFSKGILKLTSRHSKSSNLFGIEKQQVLCQRRNTRSNRLIIASLFESLFLYFKK